MLVRRQSSSLSPSLSPCLSSVKPQRLSQKTIKGFACKINGWAWGSAPAQLRREPEESWSLLDERLEKIKTTILICECLQNSLSDKYVNSYFYIARCVFLLNSSVPALVLEQSVALACKNNSAGEQFFPFGTLFGDGVLQVPIFGKEVFCIENRDLKISDDALCIICLAEKNAPSSEVDC